MCRRPRMSLRKCWNWPRSLPRTFYTISVAETRDRDYRGQEIRAHGVVGVDIDPQRIQESQANARTAGVENRVKFIQQDAMTVDVSPRHGRHPVSAAGLNRRLRGNLTRELKPGSRIVSHAFDMDEWEPLKVEHFTDSGGMTRTLYLWKADGTARP